MRILPLIALFTLPLPAAAESLSAEIARAGLKATEARLAALPTPTDADCFGLAGTRFLGTVEAALQLRYASGMTDRTGMLPFLRIPMADNPTPAPFDPATIATLFTTISTRMDAARAPLAAIPDTADFGLEINFADLWFDINANQSRDPGEDMLAVLGPMLLGGQWDARDPKTPAPSVRFDAADAAWLSAYTHLLGGLSDIILAYDPTEPTARIMAARTAMAKLGTVTADPIFGAGDAPDSLDILAIALAALAKSPDPARMTSAHSHLLAMIADNRQFWARVEMETDNAQEWLPNDRQKSALGVDLPQGAGAQWQAVLTDAEHILNGDLLLPYWRLDGPVGVNVSALFTDPRPIDIPGWIHGWAALPYLQNGTVVSAQSWNSFDQMMSGQAMMLSLYLN
jgi:hypothetical protein